MPLSTPTGFAPEAKLAYAPITACRVCAEHLPLGPRPIFRLHGAATIALISQAPGRLAHLSGVAWDDPSGRKLREWLGVDETQFFDSPTFAVTPMGMCYPGKGKGGDLPPRPECAPLWQDTLLKLLPNVKLKILIGAYSQKHYLGARRKRTLTETVRSYEEYLPEYFVLPHPSPRNGIFMRRNPWIEEEVIPELRRRVAALLLDGQ
ncbi:uracil-DNA glycosylase family protein [Neolewinella antarctica]|uniref:Uracil-DNA glycosylase n=1 Tax=Neolewinella antarctica TaxID=442734 RepID=A0ABX0XGV3_9BACT|nr:uracil-DNA glycosylase family protein [Neolewinella antarctica]NJC28432.1 uracil-DNA glycosylase [Neolewinella antarctica]